MKARLLLAAMLVAASTGLAHAARFNENDLRLAMIQMAATTPEAGQTVDALISCLRYWNPGDRRAPNQVEITRLKHDTFTVSAVLRSRAIFHFQVVREYGYLVALLQRVEYALVTNAAYQQLTDAESKRAVLRGACEKP
jgi:hypothetical protein